MVANLKSGRSSTEDASKVGVNSGMVMRNFLKSVLSILLGGALAFALAILCRDNQVKRAVPAIFVVVLALIAQLAGRMASLLTALVGGLIFAVHLFEPYGNLVVGSAADRMILYCFALVALVLAYAFPQAKRNQQMLPGVAALIERNELWIALGIAVLSLLTGVLVLFLFD
jgi:K+-sensing histidine kinase KdpD